MQPNDGGPAFPVSIAKDEYVEFGMSLRDYFAGQALNDCCRRYGHAPTAAEMAYRLADEMLKAREGKA